MSNRTLIELNHDYWDRIARNPDEFIIALILYLGSGDKETSDKLSRYGLRIIGMKHHSEGHDIKWGSITEQEK